MVLIHVRNKNGEMLNYKARLVAQGFSQEYGTDYQGIIMDFLDIWKVHKGVAYLEYKVCKLLKSLYGLKLSLKCWNRKLHACLTRLGFKSSKS